MVTGIPFRNILTEEGDFRLSACHECNGAGDVGSAMSAQPALTNPRPQGCADCVHCCGPITPFGSERSRTLAEITAEARSAPQAALRTLVNHCWRAGECPNIYAVGQTL